MDSTFGVVWHAESRAGMEVVETALVGSCSSISECIVQRTEAVKSRRLGGRHRGWEVEGPRKQESFDFEDQGLGGDYWSGLEIYLHVLC